MTLIFKYMNPLWWAYAVTFKPLFMLLGFILSLPIRILKYCKSWYTRLIFGSMAIWVAIPGTVPLTLYWIAGSLGYKEEADALVDFVVTGAQASWAFASTVYKVASVMMA